MERYFFLSILALNTLISCQNDKVSNIKMSVDTTKCQINSDTIVVNVKPLFVTKFVLGEKNFFEERKDSQSYLPNDFIYDNGRLLFFPGKSRSFELKGDQLSYSEEKNRNLITYDLKTNMNIDNSMINETLANSIDKSSYVEKLFVKGSVRLVLFNDRCVTISRGEDGNDKFSNYKTPSNIDYIFINSEKGTTYFIDKGITEFNFEGQKIQEIKIKTPEGNYEYYNIADRIYTTGGEYFTLNDVIKGKRPEKIMTGLKPDDILNQYALLGVSDRYSIWVKNAISSSNPVEGINTLLFFDLNTGFLFKKINIDSVILDPKSIDQTYYPNSPTIFFDPPELRQYLRLCYGDGKYYLMFQSQKAVYIYSFSI